MITVTGLLLWKDTVRERGREKHMWSLITQKAEKTNQKSGATDFNLSQLIKKTSTH